MSRKRLGRGLDALLSAAAPADLPEGGDAQNQGGLDELPIEHISRSRFQPRREFDEESLNELAASIKSQGLMQPIVVRPRPQGRFELIAGERRWRAAQLAGLTRIPAVVRDVNDEQASAMALIENIQREDLNPLEEAMALDRLKNEFELTQQQVADAVGKSRVTVTNLLRLLNLSPKVRQMLSHGDLEMGHARALLSLDALDQERVANEVVEKQLSVRQTEALVRKVQNPTHTQKPQKPSKDSDTRRLEQTITDKIGAPVGIEHDAKGGGQITIKYNSLDELDGILQHIS